MRCRVWVAMAAALLATMVLPGTSGCRAKPKTRVKRVHPPHVVSANTRCLQWNERGFRFGNAGRLDSALACFREALALARDSGLNERAAASAQDIGIIFDHWGQLESARHYYDLARTFTDTSSWSAKRIAIGTYVNRAAHLMLSSDEETDTIRAQADIDSARAVLELALSLTRQMKDRAEEAIVAHNLGGVLASQGKHDSACALYEIAYQEYKESHNVDGQATALCLIGHMYFDRGVLYTAEQMLRRAFELAPHVREKAVAGDVLANLGVISGERGDLATARRCFEDATAIYQRTGHIAAAKRMSSYLVQVDFLEFLRWILTETAAPRRKFDWFGS